MATYLLIFWLVAITIASSRATVIGGSEYIEYCKYADELEKPRTCLDLLCRENTVDGVYTVYPYGNDLFSLQVFCDQTTDGGGWTLFQRRMDGWVDFYRNWQNYKLGFGDVNAEHWLGLDKLNILMSKSNELWVDMETFNNEKAYAKYSSFNVGNRSTDYLLQVSGFSGDAGDSLSTHNKHKFSTYDRDNDVAADGNCAELYHGAWWYGKCHAANLNGNYHNGVHKSYADGINWLGYKGHYESLKTNEMKFRAQL